MRVGTAAERSQPARPAPAAWTLRVAERSLPVQRGQELAPARSALEPRTQRVVQDDTSAPVGDRAALLAAALDVLACESRGLGAAVRFTEQTVDPRAPRVRPPARF